MFVPDLLHEFELGVWKNTFKHLVQILHVAGRDLIQELNFRYIIFLLTVLLGTGRLHHLGY